MYGLFHFLVVVNFAALNIHVQTSVIFDQDAKIFPSLGDLPNPGIEPGSPVLQADTLPSEPPGKSRENRVFFFFFNGLNFIVIFFFFFF